MMAESDEQPRIYRFMWETVQQSQPPHRKDSCQAVRPGKQAFQASCSGLENQGNQGNQGEEHQQEPCSRAVWDVLQLLPQGRDEMKRRGLLHWATYHQAQFGSP